MLLGHGASRQQVQMAIICECKGQYIQVQMQTQGLFIFMLSPGRTNTASGSYNSKQHVTDYSIYNMWFLLLICSAMWLTFRSMYLTLWAHVLCQINALWMFGEWSQCFFNFICEWYASKMLYACTISSIKNVLYTCHSYL